MVRGLPLCGVPIPVGLRRWWGLLTHTPSLIPSTPRGAAKQSPRTRPTSLLSFTSVSLHKEHAQNPCISQG